MGHIQDQLYIDKVLQGDSRAYAVLIDRYKHMVYTLALKMVKNKEDAEEVAQDVFLKAYRALKTFKGQSKFSTWLYKIAYYRSLDYVKKNKRNIVTTMINISEEYNIASMESTLDLLENEDRKATIKSALEGLSGEDSTLITLHYFEDLSLKEISEIMGLSANTLKVRLFRSRKRLAELLKNKLEPEIIQGYGRK